MLSNHKKEVTEVVKDGNESVVTISYKVKFINSANLWQLHYQILLIISQKELTKLNAKTVIVFLNMKVSKNIEQNINAYFAIKIIQAKLVGAQNLLEHI